MRASETYVCSYMGKSKCFCEIKSIHSATHQISILCVRKVLWHCIFVEMIAFYARME